MYRLLKGSVWLNLRYVMPTELRHILIGYIHAWEVIVLLHYYISLKAINISYLVTQLILYIVWLIKRNGTHFIPTNVH
jgi:hypothetical protein